MGGSNEILYGNSEVDVNVDDLPASLEFNRPVTSTL
jgi:hypothetical protein